MDVLKKRNYGTLNDHAHDAFHPHSDKHEMIDWKKLIPGDGSKIHGSFYDPSVLNDKSFPGHFTPQDHTIGMGETIDSSMQQIWVGKPQPNTNRMLRYKKPKYDVSIGNRKCIKSRPPWFKPPKIK